MVTVSSTVNNRVTDLWWLGVVAGIAVLFFGIAALFWPGLTLVTFVYLFSAFVLVWGVVSIVKGVVSISRPGSMWWLPLLFGILALGVGVYLVRHPAVSFQTLILLVGFGFIVRGIFDGVEGVFGGGSTSSKVISIIVGILGVLAGIFLLSQPVSAGVAFVWIIGLYCLVAGPMLIALAIEEHSLNDAI